MLNRKNMTLVCGLVLVAQVMGASFAFADSMVAPMTQKAAVELLGKEESLNIVKQGMKDQALAERAKALTGLPDAAALRTYLQLTLAEGSAKSAAEKEAALSLLNSFRSAQYSAASLSQVGVAGVNFKASAASKNIALKSTVNVAGGTTAMEASSANLTDEAILATRNRMIVGDINGKQALSAIEVYEAKPYIAGSGVVRCANEFPAEAVNNWNGTVSAAGTASQARVADLKAMIVSYEALTGKPAINFSTLIEKCDMTNVADAATARAVAQAL